MIRNVLYAALVLAAFAAGLRGAQASDREPMFDDQAYHTQLLPRGTLEYDYAVRRKEMAQTPKPSADAQQIGEAMTGCDQIQKLSAATREKCEIRARQAASGRKPAAPLR